MDIVTIQASLWGAIVGFSVGFMGNMLATTMFEYFKPEGEENIKKYLKLNFMRQ